MSRPSSMTQRPLTLTEELEKLEQSITLTLQEIDHNFSQAHRIVTTSILPLVEQYAENSRDVWQGAKFWKQFFEASANVSLSGYEEKPNEEETTVNDEHTATEETDSTAISENPSASYETQSSLDNEDNDNVDLTHNKPDDLDLTSLTLTGHSTPRAPTERADGDPDLTSTSSIAYSSTSPYETLKQQVNESESPFGLEDSNLPSTPPGKSSFRQYHGTPMSPGSSPFVPPASHEIETPTTNRKGGYYNSKPSDPVMHRMPDKTYRVQATPLGKGAGAGRSKFNVTPKNKPPSSKYAFDDSPLSSPEPEAPQLNDEIFSSPIKSAFTPGTDRKRSRPSLSSHLRVTPQPGISVLTPAKGGTSGKRPGFWDSDDEDMPEDFEDDGFSPPKTMQFHIPQSRLMKTPAKEASKRIVEDLLVTAGADDITDSVGEQSPSLIRRAEGLEDESF